VARLQQRYRLQRRWLLLPHQQNSLQLLLSCSVLQVWLLLLRPLLWRQRQPGGLAHTVLLLLLLLLGGDSCCRCCCRGCRR
jgi:hypothetical protein